MPSHMLHHLSFAVVDLDRSAVFYDAALGALGFERVWTFDDAVGYGSPGGGDKFAIKLSSQAVAPPEQGFHVAFSAPTTQAVDAFHAAAVGARGVDNGPPGLRPQ